MENSVIWWKRCGPAPNSLPAAAALADYPYPFTKSSASAFQRSLSWKRQAPQP
jgi:hypothetical protein